MKPAPCSPSTKSSVTPAMYGKRNLIDEDTDIFKLRDAVAFLLGIEIELILKAGASAAGDRDTQALLGAEALFRLIFRTISTALGVSTTSGSAAFSSIRRSWHVTSGVTSGLFISSDMVQS